MQDGTLVDPPGDPSCTVCGSDECARFHEAPYPDDYPFLPGGYDRHGDQNVQPRPQKGRRRGGGLRCS